MVSLADRHRNYSFQPPPDHGAIPRRPPARRLLPPPGMVWDRLLSVAPEVRSYLDIDDARQAFALLSQTAEQHGRSIYDELVQEHNSRLMRERKKGEYAFVTRRKIIERVGLPQVRDYRLSLLRQEERAWNEDLNNKAEGYPDMAPLLVVRVEGGTHE